MSESQAAASRSIDDIERRVRERQADIQRVAREIAVQAGLLLEASSVDGLKRTAAARAMHLLGEGSRAANLLRRFTEPDSDAN